MAGAKPGERRGGRQKGTPNKRTEELYERAEATGGPMPADMMLELARDAFERWQKHKDEHTGMCLIEVPDPENDGKPKVIDWGRRAMSYAAGCAPYYHPTMKSVEAEVSGKDGGPIEVGCIEVIAIKAGHRPD